MTGDLVELPLPDGRTRIVSIEKSRVYDVYAYTVRKRVFSFSFPFIRTVEEPRVSFRYQVYSRRDRELDDKHVFRCTLPEFAAAIGISYTSFAETQVAAAVTGRD